MEQTNEQRRAVFPASFDPITLGHEDLIQRGSFLFDTLYVLVTNNYGKKHRFTIEQRYQMVTQAVSRLGCNNVVVIMGDGKLLVDELCELRTTNILRGLRNSVDFEYEARGALLNSQFYRNVHSLYSSHNCSMDNKSITSPNPSELTNTNAGIETVFLVTKPDFAHISSSLIRELLTNPLAFRKHGAMFLSDSVYSTICGILEENLS